MKLCPAWLCFVLSGPAAVIAADGAASAVVGAEDTTVNAVVVSDAGAQSPAGWRDAILAEVLQEFQKRNTDAAPAPAEPEPVSSFVREPVDPDVVVLEPLTVTERFDVKRFERAMGRENARVRATGSRWGTGALFTRDIGNVCVQVHSVLYVPIMFGLSW